MSKNKKKKKKVENPLRLYNNKKNVYMNKKIWIQNGYLLGLLTIRYVLYIQAKNNSGKVLIVAILNLQEGTEKLRMDCKQIDLLSYCEHMHCGFENDGRKGICSHVNFILI